MDTNKKMLMAFIILSSVNEVKEAPEGIVYAGLMSKLDLDTFQVIVGGLVETGLLVRRAGPCLAITENGRKAAEAFDITISKAQSR